MARSEMREHLDRARLFGNVILALAEAEAAGYRSPVPAFYKFLAEELDAQFEQVDVELEDWARCRGEQSEGGAL